MTYQEMREWWFSGGAHGSDEVKVARLAVRLLADPLEDDANYVFKQLGERLREEADIREVQRKQDGFMNLLPTTHPHAVRD